MRRLGPRGGRQRERPGGFWGALTGPSPTDRAKAGTKHHVVTDGGGVPLAAVVTAGNVNDVTQLIPLVDAGPPGRGKPGAPLRKPKEVMGDRGYDSDPHRVTLSCRGIATAALSLKS